MMVGDQIGTVSQWGWMPVWAALLAGCSSSSIATLPAKWGDVDTVSEAHCTISGEYKNVGESASYGESRASNKVFLDHLLIAGRDGPQTGRTTEYVSLLISDGKLFVTFHSKDSSNENERLSLKIDACQGAGYTLKFFSVTQSEYSAVDHRTVLLSLMASTDGSLIGRASIEFVSKGALLPSTSRELVWYRFQKR